VVVTVAEEVVTEDMEAEDTEAVGMAAVGMTMWITWYWNCLRANNFTKYCKSDVKCLENGFVLCGLFNDVSMESYIHSLER
jgi:hypothetical protein